MNKKIENAKMTPEEEKFTERLCFFCDYHLKEARKDKDFKELFKVIKKEQLFSFFLNGFLSGYTTARRYNIEKETGFKSRIK
jgi:hypothetical protein